MSGDLRAGDPRAGNQLVLARHMPELLFGAVVSASILAASSGYGQASKPVAIAAATAVAIYWLAHVYQETLRGRFEDDELPTRDRLRRVLRQNNGIVIGALVPIVMFTVALMLDMSVSASVWLALGYTVALLAGAAAYAAHQAGVRGRALITQTIVGASFGLAVILLNVVLH
jgi:hypothetical protein